MATFEVNDMTGTFDGQTWTVDDPFLRDVALPAWTDVYIAENGGSYNPDQTNAILDFVMQQVGGRVVEPDPPEAGDDVPGRVYQQKVQSS